MIDADPGTQGHPPIPVQLGDGVTHRSPSTRPRGVGSASTTVTDGPQSTAGGGHLGSDESGPDDHHPGSLAGGQQIGTDRLGVLQRPEDMDVFHVLGVGPGAGPGTGGDDQAVVVELLTVAGQGARLGVE